MRNVRLGLRLRLALACAFLSASIGVLGVLMSMLVVDSSLQTALQFAPGQLIDVTIPGHVNGPTEGSAVADAVRRNAAETLLLRGLLITALSAVLGGVAGYAIAARALGPVGEVTAAARRIAAGAQLEERIALLGPRDELRDLADTFDAMLGRLERSFDAQRRFVANASHELRTPLSIMRTEVEVTMADPGASAQELRDMGDVVKAATVRADRLVEALLVLAKAETQIEKGLEDIGPCDIAQLLPAAIETVASNARAHAITIDSDTSCGPVIGDEQLLERVVTNLLQNAVRHNRDGGTVHVHLATALDEVILSVSNTGQQLDPNMVDELFAPFRRAADRTASSGTGLGLSIVRAIVLAHRGTVEATARDGGGLLVTVRLPRAPVSVAQ
ncbi:MAG: HAMP domain-containing sensor histidine kinase [Antricoccus sp.]